MPDPMLASQGARGPPVYRGRVGPPLGQPALCSQLHIPPGRQLDVFQILGRHGSRGARRVVLVLFIEVIVQARSRQQRPPLHSDERGAPQCGSCSWQCIGATASHGPSNAPYPNSSFGTVGSCCHCCCACPHRGGRNWRSCCNPYGSAPAGQ